MFYSYKKLIFSNFIQLVFVRAANILKIEISKNRLGFLWWIIEPLLMILVYYLAFGVLLQLRTPLYLVYLIIGVMIWQWFALTISISVRSIQNSLKIIISYRVNKLLFPLAIVIAQTIKSAFVFIILVIVIFIFYDIGTTWIFFPLILLVCFTLILSISLWCALILPFFPDFDNFLNIGLRALMFCSGIFYTLDVIPENLRDYFLLNPMALIIKASRDVLIRNEMPDLLSLGLIFSMSVLLIFLAVLFYNKLQSHYFRFIIAQ